MTIPMRNITQDFYAEPNAGHGEQPVHTRGGNGPRIVKGDRVTVRRDAWTGKVGIYVGREPRSKRVLVRFEENGGAVLHCYPSELTALKKEE
jgi:hypothetical protein